MWPFGRKNAVAQNAETGKPGMKTTQKERMVALAVITVVLIIAAGVALVATSAGTQLGRCTRIVVSQQRYSCLLELANSTANASVCGYLSGAQAEQCISGVALVSGNASTCSSVVSNATSYAQCITSVGTAKHDASYCSVLDEPYLSACAYGIAESGNFSDRGACGLIGNLSLRNDCMSKSYYNEAVLSKDAAYCTYLPSVLNTSLVLYMSQSSAQLFGISNATATLPYLNATTPQEYCYYNLALLGRNESLCGAVTGQLNTLCRAPFTNTTSYNTSAANVITLQNVSTLCSGAPEGTQSLCESALYVYIAVENRNVSICGTLSSLPYQDACYTGLASKYNDSSYCSYIQNGSAAATCAEGISANPT